MSLVYYGLFTLNTWNMDVLFVGVRVRCLLHEVFEDFIYKRDWIALLSRVVW